MVLIDRGAPLQRPGSSDRPIIYSSETLTLCGSPPRSPMPARSPVRPPSARPPRTFTAPPPSPLPIPQAYQFNPTPRPGSASNYPARRETSEPTVIVDTSNEIIIQEFNARLEDLAQEAAAAREEAQASRDAETEWRIRALEAEAHSSQREVSQRSNLVGELKAEAALWRVKFSELLEEHSALQARLESATAQVGLLNKALNVLRSDNADISAALTAAETAASRNAAELEAAKQELAARAAAGGEVEAQRQRAEAALDAERRASQLTSVEIAVKGQQLEAAKEENQRLYQEVESLGAQVRSLEVSLREKNAALVAADQQQAKLQEQQQQQQQQHANVQQQMQHQLLQQEAKWQRHQPQEQQRVAAADRNLREVDVNRNNASNSTAYGMKTNPHAASANNIKESRNIISHGGYGGNNNTSSNSSNNDNNKYQYVMRIPSHTTATTTSASTLPPPGTSPVRRPGPASRDLFSDRPSGKDPAENRAMVPSTAKLQQSALQLAAPTSGQAQIPSNVSTQRETPNTAAAAQTQQQQDYTRHTMSYLDNAKAMMARTTELEDSLLARNIERSSLETELAKFPSGTAGRTGAERRRRAAVEHRLAELGKEIGTIRFELRKFNGK